MKKILLTTTALTLIAGAASAGISLSGSGRMGVVNTNTQAVAGITGAALTAATAAADALAVTAVADQVLANTAQGVYDGLGGAATAADQTTLDAVLATAATSNAASVAAAAALVADTAGTAATNTTATTHRLRVNINASGETDGGLTFGAFVRLNMNGGALGAIGAPRLWIGNGTATLTIGNASGAVAQAGNIWNCSQGFTGSCAAMPGAWSWASHSSGGTGNNVIRVDFALGSANLSVSGGNTNDTEVAATFALGAAKVGVSYDNGTGGKGGTQLGVSFDAGSANIGVLAARSDNGFNGATVSVGYGIGGGTLNVFGGTGITNTGGVADGTRTIYGVSYSQSLGGGATAAVSARSIGGNTVADAGVKFSF